MSNSMITVLNGPHKGQEMSVNGTVGRFFLLDQEGFINVIGSKRMEAQCKETTDPITVDYKSQRLVIFHRNEPIKWYYVQNEQGTYMIGENLEMVFNESWHQFSITDGDTKVTYPIQKLVGLKGSKFEEELIEFLNSK